MTKAEATELFGSVKQLCQALDIDRQTFYRWSDPLPQTKVDHIRGAYFRICEDRDKLVVHTLGGQG